MTCGTKDGELHLYPPLKAIRRKCLDCCCGSAHEVKLCPVMDCSLHPYRFGKRPKLPGRPGRKLSDEERQALAEKLSEARSKKRQEKNSL